jgi:hypothetical protein
MSDVLSNFIWKVTEPFWRIHFSEIWGRVITGVGHSMSSEPDFQHSDPRMKLSICEAKVMNSFGDFFFQKFKKVGFLKIQI